ncbi:MAG: hypothetical protein P4L83_13100 [Nevskia sp.]|nr:hypothetical protein [Nevskia sp.]
MPSTGCSRKNWRAEAVTAVCAALAADCWAAGPPPPDYPFGDGFAAATLPAPPAAELRLGRFAVRLERTRMAEVRKAAGAGEVGHRGDAGASLYWLCYTLPHEDSADLLWFTSGELYGGGEIDGIVARRLADGEAAPPGCPVLPAALRPAALRHGLWLGSTTAQLQAALPRPSATRDGWLEYSYAGTLKGPYRDPGSGKDSVVDYDVGSDLLVKLKAGRIVFLYVNQDTTF